MEPITLVALGDPKGQPRPKAVSVGGHARVYDPGTSKDFKACIVDAVREAGKVGLMLDVPLCVDIECFFRRPKGHYGSGKNSKTIKPSAPIWNTSKPDRDNIEKAIFDALTNIGFWRDDSIVVDGKAPVKKFSDGAPRTVIKIREATL
jgi:Holliday junction resolvase RusA-like endonuclease